jgi:hypothetical protein
MDRMSNVFSVRGNVSSTKGKGVFVETEKTGEEHYTLLSMVGLPLLILGPLKRHLFTISFLAISGYASPVQVAI